MSATCSPKWAPPRWLVPLRHFLPRCLTWRQPPMLCWFTPGAMTSCVSHRSTRHWKRRRSSRRRMRTRGRRQPPGWRPPCRRPPRTLSVDAQCQAVAPGCVFGHAIQQGMGVHQHRGERRAVLCIQDERQGFFARRGPQQSYNIGNTWATHALQMPPSWTLRAREPGAKP